MCDLYKTYPSDKIVIDLETTGFNHGNHIIQVAYCLYDNANNLLGKKEFYVYDGVHSKPYFNTIEEKKIIQEGISPKSASDIITADINNTKILIGHGLDYDLKCITELNSHFDNIIKQTLIEHDTMKSSAGILKIPRFPGYKYPTLDELSMFLCGKPVKNRHTASGDVEATFQCYKILSEKYKIFS